MTSNAASFVGNHPLTTTMEVWDPSSSSTMRPIWPDEWGARPVSRVLETAAGTGIVLSSIA